MKSFYMFLLIVKIERFDGWRNGTFSTESVFGENYLHKNRNVLRSKNLTKLLKFPENE